MTANYTPELFAPRVTRNRGKSGQTEYFPLASNAGELPLLFPNLYEFPSVPEFRE